MCVQTLRSEVTVEFGALVNPHRVCPTHSNLPRPRRRRVIERGVIAARNVVFALVLFRFGCGHAGNVYIQKGEGGAGLDAYLPLDKSEELSLSITGCKKNGKKLDFGVGLFVLEMHSGWRESILVACGTVPQTKYASVSGQVGETSRSRS
jgi:hypothetical protein